MKNVVILGAGTAGTMVANHLRRRWPPGWSLQVVDPETEHLYQPGLLFLPFGARDERKLRRSRARTLGRGVAWVRQGVQRIDVQRREVCLTDGAKLPYDFLVIASGAKINPDMTPGLAEPKWAQRIHNFYTLDGAVRLREALAAFSGGRLVLNIAEMPIKCPVAPLEFLFLADAFFQRRGRRRQVELILVTPLEGAFTKRVCNTKLRYLLEGKGIKLQADFALAEVDGEKREIRSYDGRSVAYDLLVTIPVHTGASYIGHSGLGGEDDLNFVPTHRHNLQAIGQERIFALGDATDLPVSKAGSVAHFQSSVVAENLLRAMRGQELRGDFDGHVNCFIESGFGKALLIDFNYELEPVSGRFPVPGLGPFTLLGESRINHLGKLGFRWLYWNMLLPARPLPISNRMSLAGKRIEEAEMHARPA